MSQSSHFGPELFEFLVELRLNNNRQWFKANKGRYESDVRGPLLDFVAEFASRLRDISPHFVADPRPVGGSIFRIYRDLRFSRDKSPYKTQAAAHFRHKLGKEVHGPGFYLHLEPGEVYAGVGMWHPDADSATKIRDAMVANPDRWRRIISNEGFSAQYRLDGESLKRPPKGYDPDQPLIEDLKRKDFIASRRFTEKDACAPDFVERYGDACQEAAPFMEFLTRAVGLPW
jgi:uncharacterized protein (TIGR02453 family)